MESTVSAALLEYQELTAVAVLLLGLVVARIASNAMASLAGSLDRRLTRYATGDTHIGSTRWITIVKNTVFWFTLTVSVLVALRLLGVGGFAAGVDVVLAFIPNLVSGLVIIAAGHLLGLGAGNLLERAVVVKAGAFGARIVYVTIFAVAVVMGMQQMGVDTTFLTQLALVVIIVGAGGLTLAFALGARQHVANLVARSELQRYRLGQRIRVGSVEGIIVDIRTTGLDVRSSEGIVSIPGSEFACSQVVKLAAEQDDE